MSTAETSPKSGVVQKEIYKIELSNNRLQQDNISSRKKHKYESVIWFFGSRYAGLLLGPLYGVLLYYYIAHLILAGLPLVPAPMATNGTIVKTQENETLQTQENETSSSTMSNETLRYGVFIFNLLLISTL